MAGRTRKYVGQHHVALLALFVALGGSSYAALRLPPASVGTRQIKKHAVTPSKLSPRTVAKLKGATGSPGLPGAPGQQGQQGIPGPTGPSDAYVDREDAIVALPSDITAAQVAALSLPAGSYTFVAELLADNDGATAERIDCSLKDPAGTTLDFMKLRLGPTNPPNLEFGDVVLGAAATLPAAGTVSVVCTASDAATPDITVGFRQLVATRVGALHAP